MAERGGPERGARNELRARWIPGSFKADLDKFYTITLGTGAPPLRKRLMLWASHFGLHCVAIYRFDRYARSLARTRFGLGVVAVNLARALNYAMHLVHHVEIQADIGPGLYIGHAGTIFIGPTTIGRNFSVTHNVTVGVGHQGDEQGIPSIGDDVWVGTGSVLAGKIRIGDGVTVAHGTMLSRSVPNGCLVGGNPGRVIMQNYDNGALFARWCRTANPGSAAPAALPGP